MTNARLPFADQCPPPGTAFAVSWSGGKDGCLALDRALRTGATPRGLITMLHESGESSRSHGLSPAILQAQANALGAPLICRSTTWDNYEQSFIDGLRELKGMGVEAMVFGDIDLESHREWEERVCAEAGLACYLPLWGEAREPILHELLMRHYTSQITSLNTKRMPETYLGRTVDLALIEECNALGVDACGEAGEFHTVVTDGPSFRRPLHLVESGRDKHNGYARVLYRVAD